jgi:hypothetical protein
MYAPRQERVFARRSYFRNTVASLRTVAAQAARNAYLQKHTRPPNLAAFEWRRAETKLVLGKARINSAQRAAGPARTRAILKRPFNRPFMPANS